MKAYACIRILLICAASGVIMGLMSPSVCRAEMDGCSVYWIQTVKDYSWVPPVDQNCEYICENNLGYCVSYGHPDCPDCYAIVCFFSSGTEKYKSYHCASRKNYQPSCSAPTTCGHSENIECGYLSVGFYADQIWPESGNLLACACGVAEPCANCEYDWPDGVLNKMAQDMWNWEHYGAGGGAVTTKYRRFYCNCEEGGCEER
jgi:hypothetical protein